MERFDVPNPAAQPSNVEGAASFVRGELLQRLWDTTEPAREAAAKKPAKKRPGKKPGRKKPGRKAISRPPCPTGKRKRR